MLDLIKRATVIAPHPDDETLGCGATIAKLSNQGHNIKLLTFTDGVSARDIGDNKNRINIFFILVYFLFMRSNIQRSL